MNEELQKALGELLGKANDGIDAASGFLVAELPDVIQQLLTWYMVESLLWCVFNVITMVASIKLALYFKEKAEEDPHEMFEVPMVFSWVVTFVMFFVIPNYFIESLKIWIAPKLWLIEYAAKLAN